MLQETQVIQETVVVIPEAAAEEMMAEAAPAEDAAAGRTGETVYNTFCVACHSIGLANAPKFGDSAAWDKLLEIGMDELVSSARKGKNVMPPSGTCADCSDDEIKNSIVYMSGK
jgi:cytochrome c5